MRYVAFLHDNSREEAKKSREEAVNGQSCGTWHSCTTTAGKRVKRAVKRLLMGTQSFRYLVIMQYVEFLHETWAQPSRPGPDFPEVSNAGNTYYVGGVLFCWQQTVSCSKQIFFTKFNVFW